jgi:putative peptidoglycan lipid II flippase
MFKGFRQTVLLTIISRITGLFREMAFAFFFGATELMDSWVIAFTIPNLARSLFGEGAASSSLIPVYGQELVRDSKSAERLASTVMTVIFVILSCIVLVGEITVWVWYVFFTPMSATALKLALTGIMLPYMTLICLEAIAGGVLNSHRHFIAPAFAPIILNVVMVASLFFGGWVLTFNPDGQAYFLACCVIVSGFLQFFTQLVPLKIIGVQIKPAWHVKSEAFKKVLFLMAPMILGLTATQINILMDKFIALWFSSSAEKGMSFLFLGREIVYPMQAGAVSQLFYAQRLYQLPFGVFGISLATVVFPVMSADAARKDTAALQERNLCGLSVNGRSDYDSPAADKTFFRTWKVYFSGHNSYCFCAGMLYFGTDRLFSAADLFEGLLFDAGLPQADADDFDSGSIEFNT